MKKIIFTITLVLVITSLFAQKRDKKDDTEYVFYGVDFSQVNVVGSDDPKEKFIIAFNGIDQLLITKPKKYDLAKYAKVNIINTNTDLAKERISILENRDFINGEAPIIDINEFIKIYNKEGKNGIIIVAKELNKPLTIGKYLYIFFNGETGEVIKSYEKDGKPGGFGLKNYWAGSLLDSMK